MRKVIISQTSDSIAARECLIGIFNYINSGHDWNVRILPSPNDITPETLQDGIDGIITGIDLRSEGFLVALQKGIPMSLTNVPSDWRPDADAPVAIVHNDDRMIGQLAADHLRSIGKFRSYAYVPDQQKCFWSTYRRRGFQSRLLELGIRPVIYHARKSSLSEWLSALPKPAAILTVTDNLAVQVCEVCKSLRFKVPAQVAILGVDNDELYCSNSRPTISSIHPNHVEIGRCSAEILDRLMQRRDRATHTFVPPISIVTRESTRTIPPAAQLIQNAIDFIKAHYQEGIGVRDVARHLHVSEPLLRLRFRETHGKSLRDTLQDIRLDAATKMLSRSRTPIATIAEQCGFSSIAHMSHFFKNRLGHAPSRYRQAPSADIAKQAFASG